MFRTGDGRRSFKLTKRPKLDVPAAHSSSSSPPGLPLTVLLAAVLFAGATLAQLPPNFSSNFQGGFQGFAGLGSFQLVGTPVIQSGSGRSNAGTTVQGPILFPPAPTSRDTSGVVVGASGYGFVPPGTSDIVQGRGSQPLNQIQSSLRQSFGNYFRL